MIEELTRPITIDNYQYIGEKDFNRGQSELYREFQGFLDSKRTPEVVALYSEIKRPFVFKDRTISYAFKGNALISRTVLIEVEGWGDQKVLINYNPAEVYVGTYDYCESVALLKDYIFSNELVEEMWMYVAVEDDFLITGNIKSAYCASVANLKKQFEDKNRIWTDATGIDRLEDTLSGKIAWFKWDSKVYYKDKYINHLKSIRKVELR